MNKKDIKNLEKQLETAIKPWAITLKNSSQHIKNNLCQKSERLTPTQFSACNAQMKLSPEDTKFLERSMTLNADSLLFSYRTIRFFLLSHSRNAQYPKATQEKFEKEKDILQNAFEKYISHENEQEFLNLLYKYSQSDYLASQFGF